MAASLQDTHLPSPANGTHISNRAGKLHAVMVPYPVQGQINPMLHLAKALAKHNFIITFVNNEHNHKRMIRAENGSKSSSGSDTNPESDQSNLRFVWVDNGLPPNFDYNDLSESSRVQLYKASVNMKYPLKNLVESLNKEKPPVTFIVSGFLCYWAHSVAVELHIPSVFLWPQSAAVFSILYHTPKLVSNGFFPYKRTSPGCNDLVSYIPGVPPLHPAELPTSLHVDDISQGSFKIVKAQFDIVESCDAIIINSFEELEKDACEALRTELSSRVSFVGPLLPSASSMGACCTRRMTA